MPRISGEIRFAAGTPSFSGATITIRLEDTRLMDAPARVLAKQTLHHVSYSGQDIPFSFDAPQPDEHARCNIGVHISLQGSDEIRKGDYITKQMVPILAQSYGPEVKVLVEQV